MTVEEFRLPDVGEGVAEGELVSWLVAPGDRVEEDQPVAEVETDKALVEVPSRYDGVVEELFVEEGDVVPVGDVIISFRVGAEDETGSETEAEPADAEETPGPGGRVFAPPSVRRLARELGIDPNSPRVYPHGARYVAVDRFSMQLPFEQRAAVVGFVGRLNEEKGIQELADVAKRLP
ncbi:MAG: biotin/lipoyl-containing protein, partial [Halorubrum sp.]